MGTLVRFVTPVPYLAPPVVCETLEALVARWNGSMENGTSDAGTKSGSSVLARLPGGRVFGSGNVLSPDGRSIARDVSPDFGKPFPEHWLLTYRKIRPPIALGGTTAVIATTLGAGYGHWLLEELPRLLALEETGFDRLIAHAVRPYALDALHVRGVERTVVPLVRYAHFACETLIVPPLRETPTWLELSRVREFAATVVHAGHALSVAEPRALGSVGAGERVYVSRRLARRRRVVNEEELWARLEALRFVRVDLEDLGWAEQIALFQRARSVVSPHGAGLANVVFCTPGTRIVELFHREYVNDCYGRIARLLGMEYRPVLSPGTRAAEQKLEANRLDIPAVVDDVVRAVSA